MNQNLGRKGEGGHIHNSTILLLKDCPFSNKFYQKPTGTPETMPLLHSTTLKGIPWRPRHSTTPPPQPTTWVCGATPPPHSQWCFTYRQPFHRLECAHHFTWILDLINRLNWLGRLLSGGVTKAKGDARWDTPTKTHGTSTGSVSKVLLEKATPTCISHIRWHVGTLARVNLLFSSSTLVI